MGASLVDRLVKGKGEGVQGEVVELDVEGLSECAGIDEKGMLALFGFGVGNNLVDVLWAGFVGGFVFGV